MGRGTKEKEVGEQLAGGEGRRGNREPGGRGEEKLGWSEVRVRGDGGGARVSKEDNGGRGEVRQKGRSRYSTVRERGGEGKKPAKGAQKTRLSEREMERARTQRGREGVASVQVQGVCPLSMFDCGGQGVLLDFLWAAWR